jgi:glucokinase
MSKQPVYVGIDLGGTSFRVGLVTSEGELLAWEGFPTLLQRGHVDIIDRMAQRARELWEKEGYSADEIVGVGVGSPGPLDLKKGTVITTPNLKWTNVPLRDMLAERLEKRVTIDNDAISATFGEFWVGAGQPYDDVIGITLGTGVGGGIILGGKIHHGLHGIGGHLGHMVIGVDGRLCGCGNRGCLEAYASGTAIAVRAREALERESNSQLHEAPNPLTAKKVFQAAQKGDPLAQRIFDETGYYLAIAINNLLNLLNPEAVILMGAVANAGDMLFRPLRGYLKGMAFPRVYEDTRVLRGTLVEMAGAVGAAGFARFADH